MNLKTKDILHYSKIYIIWKLLIAIINSIEISIYTVLKFESLSARGVQLDTRVDNINYERNFKNL